MATKSSIHIKPCNIASSEAHNRRAAEYMRNIGESRIYIVPEQTEGKGKDRTCHAGKGA